MFASIAFLNHFLYFLWMIYLDFSFVFIFLFSFKYYRSASDQYREKNKLTKKLCISDNSSNNFVIFFNEIPKQITFTIIFFLMKLKNKNKNKHYNQYWKRCFGGFWGVFGFWGFFLFCFFVQMK